MAWNTTDPGIGPGADPNPEKKKQFILAPDWRARFVFDFLLPPPAWLSAIRRDRFNSGDARLVDIGLTPNLVAWQVRSHWRLAWHFHRCGLQVMLRPFNTARPYSFPVLKKIMQRRGRRTTGQVTPALDWSNLRNVRRWVAQASPENRPM